MIRITTVMDNKPSEHKALVSKHGLSYYIETPHGDILFDCGSDDSVIHNMKLLRIEPTLINHLACSHGHYDHVGGFSDLLQAGYSGSVYIGNSFFDRKMSVSNGKFTFLGVPFDENYLKINEKKTTICTDVLEVFKDCFLITNFPRIYSFEKISSRFVKEVEDSIKPDLFDDEISLVLKTDKGLVIIVGCSHPGILNMISHIEKKFNMAIYAILGGTHLVEADEERINITLDKFCELGISFIGLSHCSGEKVQNIMEERNIENSYLSVGSIVYM